MDPNTLAATLTQFGVAGLIGWMWLSERRAAAERDRHLAQAHERIAQDRVAMNAVLEALRDNTRVLGGVESTLRGLASDLGRFHRGQRDQRDQRDQRASRDSRAMRTHPESLYAERDALSRSAADRTKSETERNPAA